MDELAVTVSYGAVKGAAKEYRYVQPALYAKKTLKNGRVVWRYVQHVGIPRRSDRLAERDAKDYAAAESIKYIPGIRHNSPYREYA